ncbi:MAG: membrane protein insertion efficiency factor YidD [Vicinamibacterales bacterium]
MPADRALDSPGAGARTVLVLIRTYQLLFAWMYAGSCRFTPSCSHYAAESIRRFGLGRGTVLGLGRLLRCHPFGAHGVDPVPDPAPAREHLRVGSERRRA